MTDKIHFSINFSTAFYVVEGARTYVKRTYTWPVTHPNTHEPTCVKPKRRPICPYLPISETNSLNLPTFKVLFGKLLSLIGRRPLPEVGRRPTPKVPRRGVKCRRHPLPTESATPKASSVADPRVWLRQTP